MKGLPKIVKTHLEKARESVLLAVEVYNKPAVTFKSGAYIVLMVIGWTALLQAYFYKKGIKPIYRKPGSRRFQKLNKSDYKYWDLSQCLQEYYGHDTQNPVRKNLEFFVGLRNKIEHHSMPEIDPSIFGECQAMLFNINDFIDVHFGKRYSIRESLSFTLQFFPQPRSAPAAGSNPALDDVNEFIKQFRSSVTLDAVGSEKYSFRAFLIQVPNHPGKQALPVQFIRFDQMTDEQKQQLDKFVILQKPRQTVLSYVQFKKLYPLTTEKLITALRTRYADFLANDKFNNIKRPLQKNSKYYGVKTLDEDNPRSAKQGYYSNTIFEEFDKHYTKR